MWERFQTTCVRDGRYSEELGAAVEAALDAGSILRQEFYRSGGPRRPRAGKCPADDEAEAVLRRLLGGAFPEYGCRGEELPEHDRTPEDGEGHVWVLDPNDGTAAFQRGWRGAAVSIALLHAGIPVLGVVYAYAMREDAGDLFAWAEGQPFTRNGHVISPRLARKLDTAHTVFVSQSADKNPNANAAACFPARFRAVPSIAYRLALVAAGEGAAAVSLNNPTGWDVAGGHALLRAAGGDLFNLAGAPVTYSVDGRGTVGNCIGGTREVVQELVTRDWNAVFKRTREADKPYNLLTPSPKHIVPDTGVLARAQGTLLGQLAGDNLGALVEFQGPDAIAAAYPEGPRTLADGGTWNILAGQPTDDSEMALLLARTIVEQGGYDAEAAARAYGWWYESRPFDIGCTVGNAVRAAARASQNGRSAEAAAREAAEHRLDSQANGALMRVCPLGIYGAGLQPEAVAEYARADASLTHANVVCQDANAVFALAIAKAVRGAPSREAVYHEAYSWAESHADDAVVQTLERSETDPPASFMNKMGWVLIALQNAFYQLLHAPDLETGLVRTVAGGGDTDTNGAIAGALLGAALGAGAFPTQWVGRILCCRPIEGLAGVHCPRPKPLWPVDCLYLAERLVCTGNAIEK